MGISKAAVNLISAAKASEGEEILRVHMEYQSLHLTDLHRVFQPLAQAYSYLNIRPVRRRFPSRGRTYEAILGRAYTSPSRRRPYEAIPGRAYMARHQPLRVETLETGHSLILICKGAAAVIKALADVATIVFGAAEMYWKMKEARGARQGSPLTTGHRSGPGRKQAAKELQGLANYVEKTTRITNFQLQLDGLTWTYTKSVTGQSKSSQKE